MVEWYAALASCVRHGWSRVWVPNLRQCLWTHLQVYGSKRLSCHADLYAVSRCHTRGKSEDHTSEKTCKGSTLALKPRADVTRSPKTRVSVTHKKDLCSPKIILKKKGFNTIHLHSFLVCLYCAICRTESPDITGPFKSVTWCACGTILRP